MKTTSTYTSYEKIILNSIDLDAYDIKMGSDFENINNVYDIFLSEYGFNIGRYGELRAFSEWLQGLPTVLTVPFYNHDILSNAGLIDSDEDTQDKYLSKYWGNLSNAFFTLKNN